MERHAALTPTRLFTALLLTCLCLNDDHAHTELPIATFFPSLQSEDSGHSNQLLNASQTNSHLRLSTHVTLDSRWPRLLGSDMADQGNDDDEDAARSDNAEWMRFKAAFVARARPFQLHSHALSVCSRSSSFSSRAPQLDHVPVSACWSCGCSAFSVLPCRHGWCGVRSHRLFYSMPTVLNCFLAPPADDEDVPAASQAQSQAQNQHSPLSRSQPSASQPIHSQPNTLAASQQPLFSQPLTQSSQQASQVSLASDINALMAALQGDSDPASSSDHPSQAAADDPSARSRAFRDQLGAHWQLFEDELAKAGNQQTHHDLAGWFDDDQLTSTSTHVLFGSSQPDANSAAEEDEGIVSAGSQHLNSGFRGGGFSIVEGDLMDSLYD